MLGRTFSHYCITGKLGQGGMGLVYIAEDTLLHREVAIKFPGTDARSPDARSPDLQDQLLREARAASALQHPNIAAIYDCGDHQGLPYIVMELVRGDSLAAVLREGPLEPARAVNVALQVAEGLREAHRQGLVHRDVKPSNIILGERGQVKVLDFGIARHAPPLGRAAAVGTLPTATLESGISGTPAYMSPEQVRGAPSDGRSDLFSLGVVLYECLTGQRVFEAPNTVGTLARVLEHEPPAPSSLNPSLPRKLDAVVAKALAKDVARRYSSAGEFIDALRTAADEKVLDHPRRLLPGGRLRSRRGWAAAALLLGFLALLWTRLPGSRREPIPEARRWYEEGVNALGDGTYRKAAQALEQAVRLDSGYTLAAAHLAEAWNELDYSGRARQAMLQALPPGDPPAGLNATDLLHVQAIHRVLTHRYAEAIEKYRELVERVPAAEMPRALIDLGRTYEKADDLKAALAIYVAAAGRNPQFPAAFLRAGVVYRRTGEPVKADASLRSAESLYRALSNMEGVTEVLYQRGILANQGGDYAQARALLSQALQMAQASGNEHQRITALLQLNSVLYRQGMADEARQHALEGLELARQRGLDDLTARSLLELGTEAQLRGDSEEARRRFAEALAAAQRFGGRRTEARARFSLASLRVDLGQTDAALEDLAHALRFYREAGYRNESARCLLLQARAMRQKGQYDSARKVAESQLEAARRVNDPVQIHLALELLGSILLDQERYPQALAYFREAGSVSRTVGDRVGERWALAACGDVLWRQGRYAEARNALAEAAGMGARGQDKALQGWIELVRAEMALSEGKTSEAATRANKSLRSTPDNRETSSAASRIAILHAARSGKAGESVRLSDQALAAARLTGNARAVLQAQFVRAEMLLESGDAELAWETAREALATASRAGQLESAWRAAVLAEVAASRQPAAVDRQAGAGAAHLLMQLTQSMSPEDFKTFITRPDLRRIAKTSRQAGLAAGGP